MLPLLGINWPTAGSLEQEDLALSTVQFAEH